MGSWATHMARQLVIGKQGSQPQLQCMHHGCVDGLHGSAPFVGLRSEDLSVAMKVYPHFGLRWGWIGALKRSGGACMDLSTANRETEK